MNRPLAIVLAACLAASAACSTKRLPGTEIEETPDTRAVYDAIGRFRLAMERRDAAAVLALVSPDYFDNGGTPEPADDLDREKLDQVLPQDLSKMEGLRVDFTLRKVEVTGDRARAEVFYEAYYRVQTPDGPVPRRDADIHQVQFRRADGRWLITAGL